MSTYFATVGRPSISSKSHVIIRRTNHPKPYTRAHISDVIEESPAPMNSLSEPSAFSGSSTQSFPSNDEAQHVVQASDELSRIRELLRPPPILGIADWGIPAPSAEPCDPAIKVRVFFQLAAAIYIVDATFCVCLRISWRSSTL